MGNSDITVEDQPMMLGYVRSYELVSNSLHKSSRLRVQTRLCATLEHVLQCLYKEYRKNQMKRPVPQQSEAVLCGTPMSRDASLPKIARTAGPIILKITRSSCQTIRTICVNFQPYRSRFEGATTDRSNSGVAIVIPTDVCTVRAILVLQRDDVTITIATQIYATGYYIKCEL